MGHVQPDAALERRRTGAPRESDNRPKAGRRAKNLRRDRGRWHCGAIETNTLPTPYLRSTGTSFRPPNDPTAGTPATMATVAVDIGGTGIKASVLDETGRMEHDRVRIPTPYPLSPQKLVTVLVDLIKLAAGI